jgi:hypothetical protein
VAKGHWAGNRKSAMEGMLADYNSSARADGKHFSGARFLMHLSSLCDAADRDGLGAAVDDEEKIFEFRIRAHDDAEPVLLWRMVGESVNLQLAPPENDRRARETMQKRMLAGALGAATAKAEKTVTPVTVPYPMKAARSHWTGPRRQDFDAIRLAANERDHEERAGGAFLVYLSGLCDEQDALGHGEIVRDQAGFKLFDVVTHTGAQAIRVLRLVDVTGIVSLRLAPPEADARAAVEQAMINVAKNSASRMQARTQAPTGLTVHRWHGPRAAGLQGVLDRWNGSTGVGRSGQALLNYLEQKCAALALMGAGLPVDEDSAIRQFVVPAPDTGNLLDTVSVWRLVDATGNVDIRQAPEAADLSGCESLALDMLQTVNRSGARARNEEGGPGDRRTG